MFTRTWGIDVVPTKSRSVPLLAPGAWEFAQSFGPTRDSHTLPHTQTTPLTAAGGVIVVAVIGSKCIHIKKKEGEGFGEVVEGTDVWAEGVFVGASADGGPVIVRPFPHTSLPRPSSLPLSPSVLSCSLRPRHSYPHSAVLPSLLPFLCPEPPLPLGDSQDPPPPLCTGSPGPASVSRGPRRLPEDAGKTGYGPDSYPSTPRVAGPETPTQSRVFNDLPERGLGEGVRPLEADAPPHPQRSDPRPSRGRRLDPRASLLR